MQTGWVSPSVLTEKQSSSLSAFVPDMLQTTYADFRTLSDLSCLEVLRYREKKIKKKKEREESKQLHLINIKRTQGFYLIRFL